MSMHADVYMHICVGSMCLNKCKCVYVPNLLSPVKTKQLAVPANISKAATPGLPASILGRKRSILESQEKKELVCPCPSGLSLEGSPR